MKYSLLLAAICCLICFETRAQSCLPGGAFFTTQEQVNNFSTANPGCKVIEGSVNILGEDIRNLLGLSAITEIQGDMFINQATQLTSLGGLDQLKRIEGAVRIQGNDALVSFEGLSNLNVINGDYFYISNSPLCQNMDGLNGLDSIGGIVHIFDMAGLKSLSGMNNISYIGDRLSIFRCDSLLSLDGLNGLSEVGAFDITDNPVLNSVQALDHPIQINAQLVVTDNPELSECKVEAFCDYFIDPPSFVVFSDNGDGCSDKAQLELECTSNSTFEVYSEAIKVFPNPVEHAFYIELPAVEKIETVRLFNTQGRPVSFQQHQNQIGVEGLAAGIYFGQLLFEGRIYHFSIIKI